MTVPEIRTHLGVFPVIFAVKRLFGHKSRLQVVIDDLNRCVLRDIDLNIEGIDFFGNAVGQNLAVIDLLRITVKPVAGLTIYIQPGYCSGDNGIGGAAALHIDGSADTDIVRQILCRG